MQYAKNILNFIIKYMKNTLATTEKLSPLHLLAHSASSLRLSNTLSPAETLLFKTVYIPSVIIPFCYIVQELSLANSSLLAQPPNFPSPSMITVDSHRPDLVLMLYNASVYALELTVGLNKI